MVGLIIYKSGRKNLKCGRIIPKTDELFLNWVELHAKVA